MKHWTFQKFFPSIKSIVFPAVTSFSLSYFVYSSFFQRHFFSWRYLLLCVGLFLAFTFILGWINTNFLAPRVKSLDKKRKIAALVFSIIFSLGCLLNIPVSPVYYLLPDSEFAINFNIDDDPLNSENVKLWWIHTGQGYVHHSNMDIQGDWQYVDNALVFDAGQEVEINWTGKAGLNSEIVFQSTSHDQNVSVIWNGDISESNLISSYSEKIALSFNTSLPFYQKVLFSLSFVTIFSYLIFLLIIISNEWHPKPSDDQSSRSHSWVLYMLPMIIVWTFSLLVFWPGVFSNDSLHHWKQAVTGQFNDWQSAIYAMVLFLLIRIKYSLSFVLILRILYFSYTVAYGLKLLERKGVPKFLLWIICLIFAISPLNNMQVITLWRDIPYAISFLWLTFLFVEIYDSNGKWITKKKNIAVLIVNTLIISLLRMNGIPTVAMSILFLAVFYKERWKQFLVVLITMITALVLIKGPFYSNMGVDRDLSGQSNQILLHHIAAHLDSGTSFEESEIDYLNELLPIDEWDYQCCYAGPIYHRNDFNKSLLLSSSSYNRKLTWVLFLRNPLVNIKHVLCAGEHAWRFGEKQCNIFSTHGFNSWYMGEQDWIIPNDYSIEEASVFPELIQPYSDYLREFGFLDDDLVPCLQPAFYFFLSILSLFIAYFRNRDWKVLLIGLPLLLHTIILFLINSFPVFRYFYCNHLVGIFLIGLMFYKKKEDVK